MIMSRKFNMINGRIAPLRANSTLSSCRFYGRQMYIIRLKSKVVVRAAPDDQESRPSSSSSTSTTTTTTSSGSSKHSAMPKLPPRKKSNKTPSTKANAAAGSSNSSQNRSSSKSKRPYSRRLGSSPNNLPPPETSQTAMRERALAGLLAYTGLMGTVATAISYFVPEIDLFGNFHLDAADIILALKLMAPVYLMNILILLPNYSSWQLPEVTPESQQQMAEVLAKWSEKKAAAAGTAGSSTTGSNTSDSGSTEAAAGTGQGGTAAVAQGEAADAAQPVAAHADAPQAADNASASSNSGSSQPASPATVGKTGSNSSSSSNAGSSSSTGASPVWLSSLLKSQPVTRARDTLFLAQGHYLSLNPAVVLPPALQFTVLLADCLAAELLYRSVALQVGGNWISDRMYEAGAEDFLHFATAGLPVLPTHTAGQLAAVALLSGAWMVVVLQRALRMARRPGIALGAQGRLAAGQLLEGLSKAATQRQGEQQQQQQPPKADGSSDVQQQAAPDASKSVDASLRSTAEAADQAGPTKLDRSSSQQDAQRTPAQAAADLALAAQQQQQQASKQQGKQQEQPPQQPPHEPQWSRRLPSTLSALAFSQLVQGVRDVSQMTALGLTFVLTGNLASPFVAAVVNQVLMAALQRRGIERARQRSIAVARQMAGITRQLRDIQRRQEAKRKQQQEEDEQQQQQQMAVTADTFKSAPPAVEAIENSSNAAAAAATPAALEAGTGNSVPEAASPGDVDAPAAATAAAGEGLVTSRMEQTINVLDALLGQIGETATAGPGTGK